MKEYAILMSIFGVLIFLYGIVICTFKDPPLFRYHGNRTKTYLKYLGKTVMLVSLAPILSAIVALLGESGIIVFFSIATLVLGIIILLMISIKFMHPSFEELEKAKKEEEDE